jgi:succinate dehydrogenase/fumarate reductase-like Fe-S protein
MIENKIRLTVYKYDPDLKVTPQYVTYELPREKIVTVLDALDYIRENIDGDIGYYSHQSCGKGMCAGCTLLVNKKVQLACQTKIEYGMILEPQWKNSIVVDLVSRVVKK